MNITAQLLPLAMMVALTLPATIAPAQSPEELKKIEEAIPARPSAEPKQDRKLLVYTQTLGYRHGSIPYGEAAFKLMGEKTGAFTAHISSDPADLEAVRLQEFDAILFNNPTGDFITTPSVREGLLNYARSGKGVVGIHAASDANFNWKEYGDLIGGWFDNHPWLASDTVTLKIDQPGHPLVKAFEGESLEINDEIYQFRPEPYSNERVLELISLDTEKTDMTKDGIKRTDGDFAVSWVHKYGDGRVFYTSLGHNNHLFWNPVVLQHYLDGIQFALGDLDAPTDPAPSRAGEGDEISDEAIDAALAEMKQYDFGKERGFLLTLDEYIRQTVDKEKKRDRLGDELAEIALDGELTFAARDLALRRLGEVGKGSHVRKVESLLTDSDERIAESARQGISLVPADRADKALVNALENTSGKVRIGIINALGDRAHNGAVDELKSLARMGTTEESIAAIRALGNIGTGKAGHVLLDDIRPPENAREAWLAAMNDAAANLAEQKDKLAGRLYERVLQLGENSPARLAAFKGKAILDGTPEATALKALDQDDASIAQVAHEFLVRGTDPLITDQMLERLKSAEPAMQVTYVEILAARGDKKAVPAITELAAAESGEDTSLRVAALTALKSLGDQAAVPLLLKTAAAEKGDVASAARTTLVQMPVPEVDAELVRFISEAPTPDERVQAIEVAVERKSENALDPLFEAAKSDDEKVAIAAYKAIGSLGSFDNLGKALELHNQSQGDRVLREAGRTISTLARDGKKSDAVGQIIATYDAAGNDELKASLLAVLGRLGGTRALDTIKANVASDNAALKDAAVRALADFPEATAIEALLQISSESDSEVHKVLALRGVARLLTQASAAEPTEQLANAKKALDAATGDDEKKAIIGALGGMKIPGVLPLLVPFVEQENLKDEAAAAVIAQAPVANQFNPGETATLLNPLSQSLSSEHWNKLEEVLTPGDADGGSIRAYQLSERYQEPSGTNIQSILKKDYPPQQDDYTWPSTIWADIDENDDKGKIDFTQRFRGAVRSAIYLRVHVWSPEDRDARLDTGSDDGMRAWVNGEQVMAFDSSRRYGWWTDKTDVKLNRGWNAVVLKIGQGSGDWGTAARIVDRDGKAMDDLKYSAVPGE